MTRAMTIWRVVAVVAFVVLASGGTAIAQETPADAELPPGMSAEDMAAWMQASTPGPEHQMLSAMAGSWTFEGTSWMGPEVPPMQFTGTAERRMIYGGRILVEEVTSAWMGETFEGSGMTGFDNVSGIYWSTWVDSMSTGIMLAHGSCADGVCDFSGTYNDPVTGGPKKTRMTLTVDGDREVHEAFEQRPEGEFKSMEMVYTRKK